MPKKNARKKKGNWWFIIGTILGTINNCFAVSNGVQNLPFQKILNYISPYITLTSILIVLLLILLFCVIWYFWPLIHRLLLFLYNVRENMKMSNTIYKTLPIKPKKLYVLSRSAKPCQQ